jgi:hypothetical protein
MFPLQRMRVLLLAVTAFAATAVLAGSAGGAAGTPMAT